MAMLLDSFDALSSITEKTDEEEDKISIFFKGMKEKLKLKCLKPIKERIAKLTDGKIVDDCNRYIHIMYI